MVLTFHRIHAWSMKPPRMIGPGNEPNTLKATLCNEIAITLSLSLTHLKMFDVTSCNSDRISKMKF